MPSQESFANASIPSAVPPVDPLRVVELLARSIAQSGGRVVAVSIDGIERSWSATKRDADAGVRPAPSQP